VNVQSNWWEHFFEGAPVDLWLQAVSPERTAREADALVRALDLPVGAELLDVPCGNGRLSCALAARGYRLTGVDWSQEFLAHARSSDTGRDVAWERRDMRDLPWPARFDGAFCLGNSFGYLDDEGNEAFLRAVAAALKPGARFVLETPMVLESMLGSIQERAWWQVGAMRLLVVNQYDPVRGRLDIEYTHISNGQVDTRYGSHRAYTYRQLVELIESAGFTVRTAEPWTRQAHSVSFIATRVQT
jgi:SAM-dependent methyltransferase